MEGELIFPITSGRFGFMETGEAFEMATGRLVGTVQCMRVDAASEIERAAVEAWRGWLAAERRTRRAA